jgi:hypothetical protein
VNRRIGYEFRNSLLYLAILKIFVVVLLDIMTSINAT